MKQQNTWEQLGIGAAFGAIWGIIKLYQENHIALDEYSIGHVGGTAFGMAILYSILYRFWLKKK